MKKTKTTIVALLAGLVIWTAPVSGETTLDDFETYTDGQVIGDAADSYPWRRFGNATNDNISVTSQPDRVLSGKFSAQYCLYWSSDTRFAAARRGFESPRDLSSFVAASFTVKSAEIVHADGGSPESQSTTYTSAAFAISNGRSTYEAAVPVPLSSQARTIPVYLAEGILVLVDGADSFEDVLASVTDIGITFRSRKGHYTETIIIDDLKLIAQQVATRKRSD